MGGVKERISPSLDSARAIPARPSGAVTFLFSDIEGSTARWERDPVAMQHALRRHDVLMRTAVEAHGGHVFKTIGDAFCVTFSRPEDGLDAALDAQRALSVEDFSAVDGVRVRMALHAGTADERDDDYFGPAVNRVARLLATAHGGQIIVSGLVARHVKDALPAGADLRDLGDHRLKDLTKPEHIFQLTAPGLAAEFPPLLSLSVLDNNLPLQLTGLIGREREVAEIGALFASDRLVTLTGAGGVGKTRTALQVGADLLDGSGDGVWFVDLSPLSDMALVAGTIASALGVTERPDSPVRSPVPAPISKRASSLLLATIIAACTLFAYGACVGLVRASTHLPVLISDGHFTEQATSGVLPVICLFDGLALIALVSRTRGRTIAELWLTVAVVASLLDSIMGLICARYSYGWYAGKLFSMVSSSIVIAAFIYEITSLQSRLAAANGELLKLNEQERQAARQRLVYLAYHDPLTSLPNRSRWEEILEKSTSQAVAFSTPFALLFVDLDRFKEINDTVGHAMGDRLLVEASKRLQATLRPKDVIGRFGGDEFVVLTGELTDPTEASTLAQNLRDAIRKPFVFGERAFHVGASVGIALFPADGSTAGLLLNHADAACYQAKRAGGDCERFYTREIGDELHHRREVYDALVEAIENHAFTLHYQPLFDLRTKRVDCVEALIRWKDSSGQLVPAATFIPIAEQSGLMHSIGGWVLEEALLQARRWADDGLELRIAINVSACQLQQPGFFESLCGALEAAHVDPGMLEIEVTESATLADPAIAYEQLERCKALGVRIALDDFGTYYSSLTYLQRLPIDSIKIDRSFVRGLPFNVQDTAIVRAVITLGHELGRTIVAEGVETPEQLHWLENAGCDVIQGYYIAKPMPASTVVEWLRQRQSPVRTKALLG